MGSKRIRNKEFYAVLKGRVDEPTIFSSWGDAHPRVTGCASTFKGFRTLEESRAYLNENGASEHQEIIKNGAGETTPIWNSEGFYAVAYGGRPGIYNYWWGDKGSRPQVETISGACHKVFRTRAQAEAFIEDWKESFSDVFRRALKQMMDQGHRPNNMKLQLEAILSRTSPLADDVEDSETFGVDGLSLEE